MLTEGYEILDEIHEFYQSLYTADPELMERKQAREDVLSLIEKRLSADESQALSAEPDKEEIEEVIFKMTANKAPVSKLLANRVRKVMEQLVDTQQTGFIPNRLIIDNILALKLGQE
ncbi:hypothetical protein R1sor_009070 [Riccia sorocarpa]|uniref:Uncharacterized protein n=1 Tax=Riccia sorocarpa TaxID=122646 RepID=A0ABD3H6L9_9MARC